MCKAWRTVADQTENPASSAYCHQAADVYAQRAIQCQERLYLADKASGNYWEYLGRTTFTSLTTNIDIQP